MGQCGEKVAVRLWQVWGWLWAWKMGLLACHVEPDFGKGVVLSEQNLVPVPPAQVLQHFA